MQLEAKARDPVRSLSGGMRRRLVIARALMGAPSLLILDEPTTGLDPQARLLVWTKIRELRAQGVTILLTTHYMDEAERLADHLIVVDQGRVLERGTPRDLIQRVVGDDCLEIQDLSPAQIGAVDQALKSYEGAWCERQADALLVYGPHIDDLVDALSRQHLLPPRYYRRRASLEDVFLRLTGRELRE
jgi:lipooligosaccharide transport system ATP-binding protein